MKDYNIKEIAILAALVFVWLVSSYIEIETQIYFLKQ